MIVRLSPRITDPYLGNVSNADKDVMREIHTFWK